MIKTVADVDVEKIVAAELDAGWKPCLSYPHYTDRFGHAVIVAVVFKRLKEPVEDV